ncbi:hypothetical protein [Seleniivibrio woodruffii]|uniref:hypothetical protein n=1 Tax=Seleniivibrio woodruffii TaxID=1078050 RepID=UPI00240A683D|nr:hypothetical protein [Seleniivibrio woodruffii]
MSELDIRIKISLLDNHKYKKLERVLGETVIKNLLRLWTYARAHRPDGILSGMATDDIEIICGWTGEANLVDTLLSHRFLDKSLDGNTFIIHDWLDHNPYSCGSAARSNKARLISIAKNYPESYKLLVDKGYDGISKEDYSALVNQKTGIHKIESVADASETLAPSPLPIPDPSISPTPSLEISEQIRITIEYYHQYCTQLSKAKPNKKAKTYINNLWELLKDVQKIELLFIKAAQSNFLNGAGARGFKADFEWLIVKSNAVKVLAGVYDNNTGSETRLLQRESSQCWNSCYGLCDVMTKNNTEHACCRYCSGLNERKSRLKENA